MNEEEFANWERVTAEMKMILDALINQLEVEYGHRNISGHKTDGE